ncbi:hypothetical protein Vretimale_8755, partial [Volvox reticuliferus]
MCGRARCSLTREAVLTAAGVPEPKWRDQAQYRPSYNCSPGSWIPVLKLGPDGARELQTMKWGLVPAFTRLGPGERPDHFRMFNARSESLTQKSVFSRLLPGKRCIVLLDGFYEWLTPGGGAGGGGAASRKQPYHITTADAPKKPAMYLAGLYDVYLDSNGVPVHTFTIITTDSSEPLAWLHDRMPVILTTEEEISAWLGEVESKGTAGLEASLKADAYANQKGREEGLIAAAATPGAAPTDRECLESPHSQGTAAAAAPGAKADAAAAAAAVGPEGGGGGGVSHKPNTPLSAGVKRRRPSLSGEILLEAGVMSPMVLSDLDDGDKAGKGSGEGESEDEDRCSKRERAQSCTEVRAIGARRECGGSGTKRSLRLEAVKQRCEVLVEEICRPYGGPLLRWHPVTPEMGKPGYDKPDCCKDVRTKKGSIASFFKPAAMARSTSTAATTSPMVTPTVKMEAQPQPQPVLQGQMHIKAKEAKE